MILGDKVQNQATEVQLAKRELIALKLLAQGYTREMVGLQMSNAKSTIDQYVTNIILAFHANNLTHAVALAVRQEII